MNDYEIRIVRARDNSQLVITATLLGDHAAVRRAQMLAGHRDLVEVWRGMKCVYSTATDNAWIH
ncbi:MAG TPA: hypothetical protein VGM68_12600 [Rhizomicrobium sp.]|jgi:hypothetical protein